MDAALLSLAGHTRDRVGNVVSRSYAVYILSEYLGKVWYSKTDTERVQILTYNMLSFVLYTRIDINYSLWLDNLGVVSLESSNLESRKHAYIILTHLTPLLCSKTEVYKGIHYFSYFCSKT